MSAASVLKAGLTSQPGFLRPDPRCGANRHGAARYSRSREPLLLTGLRAEENPMNMTAQCPPASPTRERFSRLLGLRVQFTARWLG